MVETIGNFKGKLKLYVSTYNSNVTIKTKQKNIPMCNLKVEQKVVCVSEFINNKPPFEQIEQPEKGKIYTIREVRKDKDGNIGLLLHEIVNKPTNHKNGFSEQGFVSSGFRPLQYGSATSELTEKFKLTEEKSDQPIKELETVDNYVSKFI